MGIDKARLAAMGAQADVETTAHEVRVSSFQFGLAMS